MKVKAILFRNKILIYAILFSAVWHIFWISAFKVVVVPKAKRSVKFSNVSFLGPILEKSVLNVEVRANERAIPEGAYLASLELESDPAGEDIARNDYVMPGIDAGLSLADAEEFTALAVASIDMNKIEPGRGMD